MNSTKENYKNIFVITILSFGTFLHAGPLFETSKKIGEKSEVTIRKYCRATDEKEITRIMGQEVEIEGKMVPYTKLLWICSSVISDFNNSPNGGFVAKIKATNKIVGFVFVSDQIAARPKQPGLLMYVKWLAVDSTAVRQGIGRQLFEKAKEYASEKKYNSIGIRAVYTNTPAQEAYKRWTGTEESKDKDIYGFLYTADISSTPTAAQPSAATPLKSSTISNPPPSIAPSSNPAPTLVPPPASPITYFFHAA